MSKSKTVSNERQAFGNFIFGELAGLKRVPFNDNSGRETLVMGLIVFRKKDAYDQETVKTVDIEICYEDHAKIESMEKELKGNFIKVPVRATAVPGKEKPWVKYFSPKGSTPEVV